MSRSAKIKREIVRVLRQLLKSGSIFFDHFLSTLYYDLFLAGQMKEIAGRIPVGRKVAIYLIFPEPALNRGHLASLQYMAAEGYAPVVVSNSPMSNAELELLKDHSFKIILRPNYGYDFGGYRDGIRSVRGLRSKLTHLVLFNDSCWFPLPKSKSWLATAEAMDADFSGALSHGGSDWFEAISAEAGKDAARKKHAKLFHYCSFALMFSRRALQDDAFWKFWDRLRISSSKDRTVKFGERALSTFMFQSGLTCAVSLSEQTLAQSLRALPPKRMTAEVRDFLRAGGWPAYALREYLWRDFGFMFLKKRFMGDPMETEVADLDLFVRSMSEPVLALAAE